MKNVLSNINSTSIRYNEFAQSYKLVNLKVLVATVLISLVCLKLESKFTQMIKGLAFTLIIKKLGEVTDLKILTCITETVINCGPIVGIVVFQPEIRNALQFLGRKIHLKKRGNVNASLLLSVEKALRYLSKRKIGALITIERLMNLQDFIETGIHLDANVTGELLMNIFTPNTALHDGAVIIRSGKIAAASSYLPASGKTLPTKYGTRHRAALGVSEVSDSITLVVSEETGEISVACYSKLTTDVSIETCLQIVKCEMSWM